MRLLISRGGWHTEIGLHSGLTFRSIGLGKECLHRELGFAMGVCMHLFGGPRKVNELGRVSLTFTFAFLVVAAA